MSPRLVITSEGHPTSHRVNLDSHDITRSLRKVTLVLAANDPPQATLELAAYEVAASVDNTRLHIPDETVELLERFGWTAPGNCAMGCC
jgi:hypothetical protein